VQTTLYISFALVVMVIFVFLGRATDTLIPAVALPLSLLLTFVAMNVLGYSLDNLSLMALTPIGVSRARRRWQLRPSITRGRRLQRECMILIELRTAWTS
jgi:AcrB/AcrD/AcrF family